MQSYTWYAALIFFQLTNHIKSLSSQSDDLILVIFHSLNSWCIYMLVCLCAGIVVIRCLCVKHLLRKLNREVSISKNINFIGEITVATTIETWNTCIKVRFSICWQDACQYLRSLHTRLDWKSLNLWEF